MRILCKVETAGSNPAGCKQEFTIKDFLDNKLSTPTLDGQHHW